MTYEEALNQLNNVVTHHEGECTREALDVVIGVLKKIKRLEETYHNFLGYDLSKCVKYGNENEEQLTDSYSTVMMYEIAQVFDDLLD